MPETLWVCGEGLRWASSVDVAPLAADAVGLEELYKRLRDDLLEARLATGDTATVLDAAAEAARDPLRERTVTLLMRGLALEGRPAEAMQVAADFRRRVAEETGLDPSPSLAELERDIASGTLGPPAASRQRAVARPQGPLVGREREREELHRLLDLPGDRDRHRARRGRKNPPHSRRGRRSR